MIIVSSDRERIITEHGYIELSIEDTGGSQYISYHNFVISFVYHNGMSVRIHEEEFEHQIVRDIRGGVVVDDSDALHKHIEFYKECLMLMAEVIRNGDIFDSLTMGTYIDVSRETFMNIKEEVAKTTEKLDTVKSTEKLPRYQGKGL